MSTDTPQVVIDEIGSETILVPIVGTAPLLVHRWSEKAKRKLLDETQGRKTPKQPKDPKAEYEAAFYHLKDGGYGFPAIAFKSATVNASRFYGKSVTKVGLRQCMFVNGELGSDGQQMVPVVGEPVMREDVVRIGMSGTDMRYRPQFTEWSTTLRVTYVNSLLTRESVLSLIDAGGLGVGVGDWRPERGGDFGTYEIDRARQIESVS